MVPNSTFSTGSLPNRTTTEKSYPQRALIFHTILLVLALLIVINNATVILIYRRCKELRHWTNFLLICLAMSDFLAGILNIPLIVASSILALMKTGSLAIHFFSNAASDFVIITNVLILFLIFTERYLSICRPILSRNLVTYQKIRNCVILIWVSAFLLATVPLTWSFKILAKEAYSLAYRIRMERLSVNHSLFVSICCFILPSVFILCYTVAVMRMIFYVSAESEPRKKTADRRRAFCLLLVMYILLLLAWSPLITVRMIMDTGANIRLSQTTLETIVILRFLTSFLNPFIYTLFKDDFKKALLGLCGKCRPVVVDRETLMDDNV
eukprot:gene1394-15806_t